MNERILNDDIIKELTNSLHLQNHHYIDQLGKVQLHAEDNIIKSFSKDIHALKCTHKSFNNYYSNEKNAQEIIRKLALYHKQQDTYIIDLLTYKLKSSEGVLHTIHNKINNLFEIAAKPNEKFTEDDLKDHWYINTTILSTKGCVKQIAPKSKQKSYPKGNDNCKSTYTLLSAAYKRRQLNKMRILIEHGADVKINTNSVLLTDIAQKRSTPKKEYEDSRELYLAIAKLLLKNGANPNFCYSLQYPTPLLIAVHNEDQEYTQLLLQYEANPEHSTYATKHQTQYPFDYDQDKTLKNAFDLEPTGWLKEMINQLNK